MNRYSSTVQAISVISLLLFVQGVHAEEVQQTPGAPPGSVEQKAHRNEKRLSRQELEALNAKLHDAMALYYDQSYRLALPIFEEIAARIDTIDVLYWLGRTASMSGKPDLAIAKFKTVLERDPSLVEVRIELATAYLRKGDAAAAKAELQTVLAANPPEGLKQQVEQVLGNIALSDKRFFAAVRASIGPQYDTNINVGPGDPEITLPNGVGGGTLRSKQQEGPAMNANFNLDLLYDFGERDGFVWRNGINFLHNEYLSGGRNPKTDDSDFNYTQTDVHTAIEYYAPAFRARMPFGMVDRRFSNRSLSRSYYFGPSVEYNLTKALELTLGYRFEEEEFIGKALDAQSNITHTLTFGPRYSLEAANALHVLSFLGSYARRDAPAFDPNNRGNAFSDFSYDEWSIGPSYFTHFKTGTELYADMRYRGRSYDGPTFFFKDVTDHRKDQWFTASVALSQTFYKNYFVSAYYSYIRNDSNTPLFDFDKHVAGVNFGVNFNL